MNSWLEEKEEVKTHVLEKPC